MPVRSPKTIRRRSPNLDDDAIAKVVEIIDGFVGRLTYSMLIAEIELQLKRRYTRQALFRHERIRLAVETKRKVTGEKKPTLKILSPARQMESQIVARLRSENARLKAENEALLQQFVRWAYNAFTRGLDESFLNRPLPAINRGRSRERELRGD